MICHGSWKQTTFFRMICWDQKKWIIWTYHNICSFCYLKEIGRNRNGKLCGVYGCMDGWIAQNAFIYLSNSHTDSRQLFCFSSTLALVRDPESWSPRVDLTSTDLGDQDWRSLTPRGWDYVVGWLSVLLSICLVRNISQKSKKLISIKFSENLTTLTKSYGVTWIIVWIQEFFFKSRYDIMAWLGWGLCWVTWMNHISYFDNKGCLLNWSVSLSLELNQNHLLT